MRLLLILLVLGLTACSETVNETNQNEKRIDIIAHRGASGNAPEHTIPAYDLAEKQGADYIELDLGMTKDGQLIAIHDDSMSRTTNGTGKVYSLTLAEIKQLDAGSWFNQQFPDKANQQFDGLKILTLEEIIKHFGKSINYYIEVKTPTEYPGMTEELLKVLKAHHLIGDGALRGKVIIESFHSTALKSIHQQYPNIVLVQLVVNPNTINLSDIAAYADVVGPNYSSMKKEFVDLAHEKGLLVHCWTTDKEKDIERLVQWGVDGIFTDYVEVAQKAIKETN